MVTYKKFGRRYTVPEDERPEKPTKQERRVAFKKRRYFGILKKHTEELTALQNHVASSTGNKAAAATSA